MLKVTDALLEDGLLPLPRGIGAPVWASIDGSDGTSVGGETYPETVGPVKVRSSACKGAALAGGEDESPRSVFARGVSTVAGVCDVSDEVMAGVLPSELFELIDSSLMMTSSALGVDKTGSICDSPSPPSAVWMSPLTCLTSSSRTLIGCTEFASVE